MPRTHGVNKSNVFAQILDTYEVTLSNFAHVYKALIWQYTYCTTSHSHFIISLESKRHYPEKERFIQKKKIYPE